MRRSIGHLAFPVHVHSQRAKAAAERARDHLVAASEALAAHDCGAAWTGVRKGLFDLGRFAAEGDAEDAPSFIPSFDALKTLANTVSDGWLNVCGPSVRGSSSVRTERAPASLLEL